jgi:hypothetical protein
MRAVVLRDGRLEVRQTADPEPGEGELLLRTISTAICASDVHFMDHHDAVPEGGAGMVYDPDRDIVLGHELSERSSTTAQAALTSYPSAPERPPCRFSSSMEV